MGEDFWEVFGLFFVVCLFVCCLFLFTWSTLYTVPTFPPSFLQFILVQGPEQNKERSCDRINSVPFPSPTLIERNWMVWGVFLSCDINRKDKSSIKHLDISCQDYSWACEVSLKCYITGEILISWIQLLAISNPKELDFKLNVCITWQSFLPFPISVKRLADVRKQNHEICLILKFTVHCILHLIAIQWIFMDLKKLTLR